MIQVGDKIHNPLGQVCFVTFVQVDGWLTYVFADDSGMGSCKVESADVISSVAGDRTLWDAAVRRELQRRALDPADAEALVGRFDPAWDEYRDAEYPVIEYVDLLEQRLQDAEEL